jgi:hypothetical protein
METRICIQCKQEKIITDFALSFDNVNAERGFVQNENRKYRCKKCYGLRYRLKLKVNFIRMYGGKCICCGEDDIRFLSLDHVNNDGNRHREELAAHQIIAKAISTGKPISEYQILCYNCNFGKSTNGGVCPHKDKNKKEYNLELCNSLNSGCETVRSYNPEGLKLGPQALHERALERNNGFSSRKEMLRAQHREAQGKTKRIVRTKEQILMETLKQLLDSGASTEDILALVP